MNRRNFLQLAALSIAGQAAERVFPFRVYSIPETICAPKIDLVGLNGADYTHYNSTSGLLMNLRRSPYPGKLWAPGNPATAMPTPEILRNVERQMMASLGRSTPTLDYFRGKYPCY